MEERDGQHMGVVTNAFVNEVPPSSMILRVLFITCNEPDTQMQVQLCMFEKFKPFTRLNIHYAVKSSVRCGKGSLQFCGNATTGCGSRTKALILSDV